MLIASLNLVRNAEHFRLLLIPTTIHFQCLKSNTAYYIACILIVCLLPAICTETNLVNLIDKFSLVVLIHEVLNFSFLVDMIHNKKCVNLIHKMLFVNQMELWMWFTFFCFVEHVCIAYIKFSRSLWKKFSAQKVRFYQNIPASFHLHSLKNPFLYSHDLFTDAKNMVRRTF